MIFTKHYTDPYEAADFAWALARRGERFSVEPGPDGSVYVHCTQSAEVLIALDDPPSDYVISRLQEATSSSVAISVAEAAVTAGYFWECIQSEGCGWHNSVRDKTCIGCGSPRLSVKQ